MTLAGGVRSYGTLPRLDTPQLPQLGRRRSFVLAGLGSLGSLGGLPHRDRGHHGPGAHPADTGGGAGSRRRSVAKQRRDDQATPDIGIPEGPSATARSSALFSPYSPLPAIGGAAAASAAGGSMRSDRGDEDRQHGAPVLPTAGPGRLLRERTYDVLVPRFVRGPVPATPEPPLPVHDPDTSTHSSASTGGMIEDEELPTSPPGIDDEDFSSGSGDLVVEASSVSATPDGDDPGSAASVLGSLGSLAEPSRGLLALKEGYKGRLKKFWSKF
ncbi:hypothetical protein ONE63_008619 [Megalurothrips usitatus]|uniref:Uncharacterized protein n=1 Tax=Megalurothrips usitatus TaxID=439358 RepID=A0AAV7XRJ8_9NEOP|nr:hypothetical protein ONE63_008619 [Megalurothrips usitatus]